MTGLTARQVHELIDRRLARRRPAGPATRVVAGEVVVPGATRAAVRLDGDSASVVAVVPALPVALVAGQRIDCEVRSDGQVVIQRVRGAVPVHVPAPEDGQEDTVLTVGPDLALVWAAPTGGGGGAPTTVDYLVGTASGSLSGEIVVGTSPGGELGGTWASPTVDTTHSGSSHAGIQSAAEATAAGYVAAHEADTTSVHGIANTANLYAAGGTDVAVVDGGTGASDASGARTNLGLVIGTNVQAYDADLAAIAALSPSNDDVVQRKAGAWTNRSIAQLLADLGLGALYQPLDSDLTAIAALSTTSFGRSLLEAANAAALRTLAGTVIGTDVQAYDADLGTIAGLSPSNDDVVQRKSGAWANRTMVQLLADLMAAGRGTSFPGSPATNDVFFRTDRGIEYFYNGTRWLSTQVFMAFTSGIASGSANIELPALYEETYDHWIETFTLHGNVQSGGTALSGSHKWVGVATKWGSGGTAQTITGASLTLDSGASNAERTASATIDLLMGSTYGRFRVAITKTGTPGNLMHGFQIRYRLVG